MAATSTHTAYRIVEVVASVVGSMAAGALVTRLWSRFGSDHEGPPQPQDLSRSVSIVLLAAAAQGATIAVMRAMTARITARGYRSVVGDDPPLR
ncbi:DUF4235 domain-containing protein [Antrihabitans sp. YC2-6]|uniref:DUF4235 domain-containing protein n=1 Tax=Antrihabitans sp. YC2-6 TaxID=2799498 RepID=UPI0018F4C839|nr:DUF4235 domain-containing protein [Antrihabitans sp. YC2-6]MBJ8343850.1 DUF4235 domain-containing protein [Antrihabitans sp. YC2-6]